MAQDPAYLATQNKERITEKFPRPLLNLIIAIVALALLTVVSLAGYSMWLKEKQKDAQFESTEAVLDVGRSVVEKYVGDYPFLGYMGAHNVYFDTEKNYYSLTFYGVLDKVEGEYLYISFPYPESENKIVKIARNSDTYANHSRPTDAESTDEQELMKFVSTPVQVNAYIINKDGDLLAYLVRSPLISPSQANQLIESYENGN